MSFNAPRKAIAKESGSLEARRLSMKIEPAGV